MGKFGPEVSTNSNRRGFDLPFGVKKPDMDGFVHELQVFENCQYLATKNYKNHIIDKCLCKSYSARFIWLIFHRYVQ